MLLYIKACKNIKNRLYVNVSHVFPIFFSSKSAVLRWKKNLLILSKYIILVSASSSSLKLTYLLCYFNLPSDFWCSLVSRSVRFFFLQTRENFHYWLLSFCLLLLSQMSPFPFFKKKVDITNWMMTWALQRYCRNAQWVTVYLLDLVLPVPSLPSLLSGTTVLATLYKLSTEETESHETPSKSHRLKGKITYLAVLYTTAIAVVLWSLLFVCIFSSEQF